MNTPVDSSLLIFRSWGCLSKDFSTIKNICASPMESRNPGADAFQWVHHIPGTGGAAAAVIQLFGIDFLRWTTKLMGLKPKSGEKLFTCLELPRKLRSGFKEMSRYIGCVWYVETLSAFQNLTCIKSKQICVSNMIL